MKKVNIKFERDIFNRCIVPSRNSAKEFGAFKNEL